MVLVHGLLLIAFSFFSCSFANQGEWTDLSKKGSLSQLSSDGWAFDRKTNMKFCKLRTCMVHLDGRSDYTKILNDRMKELHDLGGGTLQLEPGKYRHKGQILIPSYVCLKGSGIDSTTIQLADDAPKFKNSGCLRSMHTERITIMDLTQDGNRSNQKKDKAYNYGRYGFFSELTNYLYIKSVRVQNNYSYGWDPHGSKDYFSYYLIMHKCEAVNNGLDGFTIDQTVHASIVNGFSSGNARHGFNVVTGTQLAIFRSCTAKNNGHGSEVGYGFVAQNNLQFGTSKVEFVRCTARHNFRGGFKVHDVHDVTIKSCSITGKRDSLCYELVKTRRINLRQNKCAGMRANRKIKTREGASYSEEDDFSDLRGYSASKRKQIAESGVPDPDCKAGLRRGKVCCSAKCKKCGGRGCGSRNNGPGKNSCCIKTIRRETISCKKSSSPCLI